MIDRLVIDNFKSIKHADVKLLQVNLLIGPNNSGKSNFLKSIIHLKDSIDVSPNGVGLNFKNDNAEGAVTHFNVEGKDKKFSTSHKPGLDALMSHNDKEISNVRYFANFLFGSRIYKPNFERLTYPYPIFKNDEIVLADASNIPSFLQTALNKNRDIFNRITADLKSITSVFTDILIDNVEPEPHNPNLTVETKGKTFIKLGLKDKYGKQFWADQLSEGTIYFLALLCIIHQPNPPKLLLLEEPERGIHPRRIKEIIDLIKQLATEKDIQVIITTHSPLVVNLFADEPESIFVFDMVDGFTQIKNLQTDIIEPINQELKAKGVDTEKNYDITLGEQWVFGLLGGVPV